MWNLLLFILGCEIVVVLLCAIGYNGPPLIAAPKKEPWWMRHPRFCTNEIDRPELDAR